MRVIIFWTSFRSDASLELSVSDVKPSSSDDAKRHDDCIPFFTRKVFFENQWFLNRWLWSLLYQTVFKGGSFVTDFECKFTDDFEFLDDDEMELLVFTPADGDSGAEEKWQGKENAGNPL